DSFKNNKNYRFASLEIKTMLPNPFETLQSSAACGGHNTCRTGRVLEGSSVLKGIILKWLPQLYTPLILEQAAL
ncbi:hypothetical protein NPIL_116641, partial [Nephila pilipes]